MRPTHAHLSMLRRGALIAAICALAAPAAASATTLSATAVDASGDAPATDVDITSVAVVYKSKGDVTFTLTTAAPINAAANNATFVAVLGKGKGCKSPVLTGGGVLSVPTKGTAFLQKTAKKTGKAHKGTGTLAGNVFTVKVHNAELAHLGPTCFQAGLLDESNGSSTTLDETNYVALKK
jgi:hypothetical protein